MQKHLLRAVLRCIRGTPFAVTYWDGQTEQFGTERDARPRLRIIFREELDMREMLCEPEINLGEAYMDQKIECEGDLRELISLLIENRDVFSRDERGQGFLQRLARAGRKATRDEQAQNIRYHYDLGNDFFKLWLDETMSYSCAYFQSPEDSLEQAQLQKIDHTLCKLHLKPGETLLDIGSGWGWLIIKAAREYGARTLGITISREQEEETRRRIREEGLEGKAEVRLADYRDLAYEGHVFDKVVSVGMFEHVGREYIPSYFSCLKKMLKPQGLALLHTITRPLELPPAPWLEKYIFPWGYIPSLREITWILPEYDFHLVDAESLRLHYAMTIDCWVENFKQVQKQVESAYGKRFQRMWTLYLNCCAASFRCSGLDIHQLLFSKGLCNRLPLTREYLYARRESSPVCRQV